MDPEPLVGGADPDPYPAIIKRKWYRVRKTSISTVLWLLYDFYLWRLMSMYIQKVKTKKNWKPLTKRAGSGSGSYGSPYPDQYQNVTVHNTADNDYVLFCVTGARERSARVWAICWPCDHCQDWRINDVTASGIGRETCRVILLKTPVQFLWEFRGFSDFSEKVYSGFISSPISLL